MNLNFVFKCQGSARNFALMTIALVFCIFTGCAAGNAEKSASPWLGEQGQGPVIDKSGDAELAALINNVASKFAQKEFVLGDTTIKYNLFAPEKLDKGKKYPLVMFIADASTVSPDVKAPLSQGYGALVWATEASQKTNPCFVLVPQFSGIAVNDSYEHSAEVTALPNLLKAVAAENPVDTKRIYATGQSMGGMISMYLNTLRPRIFAASFFVDCHWDEKSFDKLVENPFVFVNAGEKGRSWQSMQAIEDAARKMGRGYTWSEWSAKLPLARQEALASTMLGKNEPINLITFENGSVLQPGSTGSEHMNSFDYAYKLEPCRNWLFANSLQQGGLD